MTPCGGLNGKLQNRHEKHSPKEELDSIGITLVAFWAILLDVGNVIYQVNALIDCINTRGHAKTIEQDVFQLSPHIIF